MPTLLGIFDRPGDVASAVHKLKGRGINEIETYSPAPFEEVDDAVRPGPSPVRYFTLFGGLTGVFTGFLLQIWMGLEWPVKVAGKAFASIPNMSIVSFELTILLGGHLTVLGMILVGGLYKWKLDPAYSARFSAEEFGLSVTCRDRDVAEVDALLRSQSAKEVSVVDA
jgi:hypothetical protein